MIDLDLLPHPLLGLRQSPRHTEAKAAPARVVTIGDVAPLFSAEWAMPPASVSALLATLPRLVGLTAPQARLALGMTAAPMTRPQPSRTIAIMPIFGSIFPRGGLADFLGLATPERLAATLRQLVNDPYIDAIILDVDSPGGVVQGATELSAEVYKARASKRIIAISQYEMNSAAYWIGSAAGEIVASPSSQLGSIGVFAAHDDYSKALEREGRRVTLIYEGRHKVDGNPYGPLSDDARADLQKRISTYYNFFVGDVARGRAVSPAQVREGFGQGRTVLAQDAVRLKMADRIATMDETIARLTKPAQPAKPAQAQAKTQTAAELEYRKQRARRLELAADEDRDWQLMTEVNSSAIPLLTRLRAEDALKYCARDLRLTEPLELHWFKASTFPKTLGKFSPAYPDEIWLSNSQSPATAGETVAHEARHAWQYQTLSLDDPRMKSDAWCEQDAREYAARVMRAGVIV